MKLDELPIKEEGNAYRIFMVSIVIVFVALFAGIFFGIALRNSSLINEIILARARSMFGQIVLTRSWASGYGGVYVKKTPGVESNPWLEHPDLQAADGTMLTLRNPALITREISELALKKGDFRFRITSLKPLNPGNAPDQFEKTALELFEKGKKETWDTFDAPTGPEFRYMGALDTEASCLACHAKQGYTEGDVRGGISVSFPVANAKKQLRNDLFLIVLAAFGVLITALALVYRLIFMLKRKLDLARAALASAAISDGLTGLYNRRYAMIRLHEEIVKAVRHRSELSIAIFDADFFKSVNDQEGHQAGDIVLLAIANTLREQCRPYDIVSRYGGEEFLLIFPGSSEADTQIACDRIRLAVPDRTAASLVSDRRVTMSAGYTGLASLLAESSAVPIAQSDEIADKLLARADIALYRAKAQGRDRCLVFKDEQPA